MDFDKFEEMVQDLAKNFDLNVKLINLEQSVVSDEKKSDDTTEIDMKLDTLFSLNPPTSVEHNIDMSKVRDTVNELMNK